MKGGADWRGWCQDGASASFQCLYLLGMREGKQKGPVPSWLLAMQAQTDWGVFDGLRVLKILP